MKSKSTVRATRWYKSVVYFRVTISTFQVLGDILQAVMAHGYSAQVRAL